MAITTRFDNFPVADLLGFGAGEAFRPEQVRDFLRLESEDISRLANMSIAQVRLNTKVPVVLREKFAEIAVTCNVVAHIFGGDVDKTSLWFRVKNPSIGDVAPREMIRLCRFDRLRRHIANAVVDLREVQQSLDE